MMLVRHIQAKDATNYMGHTLQDRLHQPDDYLPFLSLGIELSSLAGLKAPRLMINIPNHYWGVLKPRWRWLRTGLYFLFWSIQHHMIGITLMQHSIYVLDKAFAVNEVFIYVFYHAFIYLFCSIYLAYTANVFFSVRDFLSAIHYFLLQIWIFF